MTATQAERITLATGFLDSLYGAGPESFGVLWVSTSESYCFDLSIPDQVSEMARHAVHLSDGRDVWFKVNPIRDRVAKGKHGEKADVAYLAALFADCDVDPSEAKGFRSQNDALLLLESLPMPPSVCVSSGRGVHAYWLLKEPATIQPGSVLDIDAAQGLQYRVRRMIENAAGRAVVDSKASDLGRILRLPGTLNHKEGGPYPVCVLQQSTLRYPLENLIEDLPEVAESRREPGGSGAGSVILSQDQSATIRRVMPKIWVDGQRHHCGFALAGWLADNQVSEDAAAQIVERCSRNAGDTDTRDRIRAVAGTYDRIRSGQPTLGWRWLEEQLAPFPDALAELDEVFPFHRVHAEPPKGNAGNGQRGRQAENDAAQSQAEWHALHPLPNPPLVPAMPPELVPDPLRGWLVDLADRGCVPLEMVAIPAIVAAGAVIGRSIGVRPWQFSDFTTVPNVWGAVVARPGWMKTDAMGAALKPLGKLAAEATQRFQEQEEIAAVREKELKAEIKRLDDDLGQAVKTNGSRDEIKGKLVEKQRELKTCRPTERRYLTHDATTAKLGDLLRQNPRGLLVIRDELYGLLRSFDKSGNEGDRQFYLEAWNGTGSFTQDRIERGTVHIPALTLSVLGSIQPGKLQRFIADATSGGEADDGLLQRFQLFVWPDRLPAWRRPTQWPDAARRDRAHTVFERLDELDPHHALAQRDHERDIPYLRLSTLAQGDADAWRVRLEDRIRPGTLDDVPAFASHLGKYRSLMPALSLIFHLIDAVDEERTTRHGEITQDAVRRAIAWCDFLEAHARKVYEVELDRGVAAARALAAKIDEGALIDGATVREIYRHGWSGLKTDQAVIDGTAVLAELGWIRFETVVSGGKPRQEIRLHPELPGSNVSNVSSTGEGSGPESRRARTPAHGMASEESPSSSYARVEEKDFQSEAPSDRTDVTDETLSPNGHFETSEEIADVLRI
jgi:hypothetical protein